MGLILGFSLLITFGVLLFQFSFLGAVILLVNYVISRIINHNIRDRYFNISMAIVICTLILSFLTVYVSYYNYLTTEVFSQKTPNTYMSRYWKKNLGRGTIGTISFVNPILSPILYLLPRDKIIESKSPYKVMDSGIWIEEGNVKVWWLNNEQVLFPSNEKMQPDDGGKSINVIWNPTRGQYAITHTGDIFCVENGLVFYKVLDRAANKYHIYRGTLENPKEYPPPGPGKDLDSCFDCDWAPEFSRKNIPYRIKLRDDNYIEIVKNETLSKDLKISHGQTLYYERLDLPPKSLPLYIDITRPGSIVSEKGNIAEPFIIIYNKLRNAYFISPSAYSPEESYYHSMWWLQRDGSLTQVPLPNNVPWSTRARIHIYPLRDGYLAHYDCIGSRAWGLYLIKGEKVEKVLPGKIKGISVSPDGCRIAFSQVSQSKRYNTIKTINFCGIK